MKVKELIEELKKYLEKLKKYPNNKVRFFFRNYANWVYRGDAFDIKKVDSGADSGDNKEEVRLIDGQKHTRIR